MKNVSTNLKTHLAGEVTTLCACWLVTRLDGVVLGFTDHDVDIVFNGVTYSAESGFLRTAISNTATAAPGELEVQGFLDSVTLTEHDLRAGLYNYATVELFMLNWSSLADGPLNLRYGNFGEVTITSTGSFKIELRGLMQRLEQQFLETYGPICRADLGDARCKIQLAAPLRQSLAPYAVGARVTVPSGPIENIAIPNGDFSLTFTTTIPGWTLVNMSDTVGDVKTTAWLASITQSVLLSSVFGITDTDNAAVTFQVHNEDLFAPSGNQQYRLAITYLDGGGGVLGTDATPYAPLVGYGFGFFSMTGTVRPGTATVVFALQTNELGGPATFTSADALQFSDAEAYITPIGAPQAAVLTNPNFQLGSGVLVMDWLPLNRPANGNNLRSVRW